MADEVEVQSEVEQAHDELSPYEQDQLSKALFPDTHTEKVELLGIDRQLKPLPIKHARVVHSKTIAMATQITTAVGESLEEVANSLDADLCNLLIDLSKYLAKVYEWDDVIHALNEEEISLSELQELTAVQSQLQKANDFLLNPLRVIVGTQRLGEMGMIQFARSLNTFSGQLSALNSDGPSTS